MQVRTGLYEIFKVLKGGGGSVEGKTHQCRILYPVKLFLKSEGETNIMSEIQKWRDLPYKRC